MLRRAADGRGDELSLAEIDDEARPDGHVQNALDQGAGGRQVADDDGIAVVVVDRADLAEQRETVVALARGARRLDRPRPRRGMVEQRSEEHTSELQSLMRISYAVFCLKKKTKTRDENYVECKSL